MEETCDWCGKKFVVKGNPRAEWRKKDMDDTMTCSEKCREEHFESWWRSVDYLHAGYFEV